MDDDEPDQINASVLAELAVHFPKFARTLDPAISGPYSTASPATEEQIAESERSVGVSLPAAYKEFLRISRGLRAFGGGLRIEGDPWYHNWPPFESLTSQERLRMAMDQKSWPPPTEGMLCFAGYCLEADGDQVLFDVTGGLVDGEYPVYYYNHEGPTVRKVADSFKEFLEDFIGGA